jgi:hypothetical protein
MTPEQLAALAGVILSLAFSYVPGLKDWFEKLDGNYKRLIMLGVMAAVVLVIFGLSCTRLLSTFQCSWLGAWDMLYLLILAAVANQTAYSLTPRARPLK